MSEQPRSGYSASMTTRSCARESPPSSTANRTCYWWPQASSGSEAIQQYREHQPDVTLMDLGFPT